MLIKIYFVLIFVISCQIFSVLLARGGPKRPREYAVEYPETRRINVTLNKKSESRVVNKNKPKQTRDLPTSRIGITGIGIEDISPETKKSNTARTTHQKNKNKVKRVTRQADEHPDCANCLDDRYLKHYYAKGCKPIEAEVICKKPCPKYFECPKDQTKPSTQGCEYKGIIYNVSDEIPNDNECLHCRCSNLTEPKITCAVSECFGDWRPLNESCYRYYEGGKCCSRPECLTDEELKQVKTCLYDGKTYKSGEKIYPKEDNCISCICNEKWNQSDPLNSESCKRKDCDFELEDKWQNKKGCVPIYHDSHCCPIDYHCPLPEEWKCSFGGKQYEIGEKLITKDNCLDCTCRIPPDFSCIKQKCESMPADTNCTPIFETNKCCPTYDCTVNDKAEATNNTHQILANDSISSTQTPILETDKPSVCPPFIPDGLKCAGTNCTTIIGSDGCQTCSCEVPCPQLDCVHPCFLFVITPGVCPQCQCP